MGNGAKGDILFHEREYPPLNPPRERFRLAVSGLNNLYAFGMQLPARGVAALDVAIRFAAASIIRCRSADLVEVQPNFRLPPVSTMRRAPAMPHSVSSLPPCYRHSRLTIVRRGCWMCRIAEIHGEAMYTAPDCAARAALQAPGRQCWGSRGPPLAFSWGSKGVILSRERMAPFPASPARCRGTYCPRQRRRTYFSSAALILASSSSSSWRYATLPTRVLGISSLNSMSYGMAYFATFLRQ